MSEVVLLSDVGADYTKLRALLVASQWKEADEETGRIMLDIADREKEGYLDSDAIKKFPCTDLRTLDELWVGYSKGQFGFSVQRRIYEEVGKDFTKMCDRIGWRQAGNWLNYSSLIFDTNAPLGHLPGGGWIGSFSGLGGIGVMSSWWYSYLASRLEKCNI
ncbi:MAG TPA: serine/threonine kinase [Cyanobacteria bacterium UBA8803]|nr:serine/threonine kinase [Cyanobacteria bacterium UBA9273]HBL59349.1 serine/threonine kinase [Cyanobacteria bacterium UBA8803]